MPNQTSQTEQEAYNEFVKSFCALAGFQGRFAYCLMSIYAVNPDVFHYFITANPYSFLIWNMIYGITIMIVSRPALKPLMPIHRLTFSLLGSLAFNYSSLQWYQWLNIHFPDNPIIRTLLGYISGRFMMVHLIAFLYHIDTRCNDEADRPRRISAFESMYF